MDLYPRHATINSTGSQYRESLQTGDVHTRSGRGQNLPDSCWSWQANDGDAGRGSVSVDEPLVRRLCDMLVIDSRDEAVTDGTGLLRRGHADNF